MKQDCDTPKHSIFSNRPIRSFGKKGDKEKSGIHTDFGPIHRSEHHEYEKLRHEIEMCVRDFIGIEPFSPMPIKGNRLVTEMGKVCIRESIGLQDAVLAFRDKLEQIKGK